MNQLLPFLLLCLLLTTCNNDDDTISEEAILEVEKDGVPFTVTSFDNTLIEAVDANEIGRRLDIRGQVDGGSLIITVFNWDWQNPPEDGIIEKSYDLDSGENDPNTDCFKDLGFTYCDGGLGTYFFSTQTFFTAFADDADPAIITITKNDHENKTVSGSFEFTTRESASSRQFSFKGTFRNLQYKVQ